MPTCHAVDPMQTSPSVHGPSLRPTAAPGARITTAFARVLDDRRGSNIAELRAATLALVATLKVEGFPPEYVLVSLKQAVGRGGWWPTLIPAVGADVESPAQECDTYSHVFEWFLEGYFGLRRSG